MKYWQTGNDVYIGDPFGDAVELSEAQYNTLVFERSKAEVRAERESKIQEIRWRLERARDEQDLGLPLTEPIEPLLAYVQALRDVPQQEGFPTDILWPEIPE